VYGGVELEGEKSLALQLREMDCHIIEANQYAIISGVGAKILAFFLGGGRPNTGLRDPSEFKNLCLFARPQPNK
jgi:hypothetical protein